MDASSLMYILEDSLITQSPTIFSIALTLIDAEEVLSIWSDIVDSSLLFWRSKFKILRLPIISNAFPASNTALPPLYNALKVFLPIKDNSPSISSS